MGDSARVVTYQPGPQTAFASCEADICAFGGQAGGGKSAALVLELAKWTHVPGYGAICFRRDTTQLTGAGSLWEMANFWYPHMGGVCKESPTLIAEWENRSAIQFRHLEIPDRTVLTHDGKQYALVCIDEGQYFTEFEIWYLWGRCRTLCGVKPYMRITCNPDPDCYLRRLLDWWIGEDGYPIPERDGVIRWAVRFGEELHWFDTWEEAESYCIPLRGTDAESKYLKPISITFIRSELSDNKILLEADPDYGARLSMLDAASRASKLGGNWNASPEPGVMFNRTWFGIMDKMPDMSQIEYMCRGWDKAASLPKKGRKPPDWTRGALLVKLKNGDVIIGDMVSCQLPPGGVDALIYHTAQADGHMVEQAFWIDPGQAGLVDEAHTRALFLGQITQGKTGALSNLVSFVRQGKNKIEYAKPWSSYADPDVPIGRMWLLRGAWNRAFLGEIEQFPKPKGKEGENINDDQVDAVSRAWIEVEKRKTGIMGSWIRAMQKVRG